MPIKIDKQYQVKKARGTTRYAVKNSPYHFVSKQTNASGKIKSLFPSNRCVLKITGGCDSKSGLSRHIDYITGKDDQSIDSEGNILKSKEDIEQSKTNMALRNENLSFDSGKGKRETFNLMFSLPGYELNKHLDEEQYRETLKKTVSEMLKEKYPNNYFVASVHKDNGHPHVHVCMCKRDDVTNKNIDIRKYQLKELRYHFSRKLIEKGFNVQAEVEPYKQEIKQFKTNDFEFVESGKARYEFKEKSPESYFVQYRTNRDEKIVTMWAKGLEDAVKNSGVGKGDRINIKKDKISKQWSITILEKSLNQEQQTRVKTLFGSEKQKSEVRDVQKTMEFEKGKELEK